MKAALIVNPVSPNTDSNVATILKMANEAADSCVDLVLFPEAALTGLVNTDDLYHDRILGEAIP